MIALGSMMQGCLAQLEMAGNGTKTPGPFRYVGYWMSPTRNYQWDASHHTYEPMIQAWQNAGANAIMISDHDLPGIKEKLGYARGYRQRFIGGGSIEKPWELDQWLDDPFVAANCEGVYFDEILWTWTYDPGVGKPFEPFDPVRFHMLFDSVLTVCEKHHKALGLTAYGARHAPRFDSLLAAVNTFDERHRDPYTGALTTSRRENLFLMFSGAFFITEKEKVLQTLDEVVTWSEFNQFPMERIFLWVSPSCDYPINGKVVTTPDCEPSWTFDEILRAGELGFGGIYFYLGNGLNEMQLEQIYYALWVTGTRKVPGNPPPENHGTMRAFFMNERQRTDVIDELKKIGIPTHAPSWNWE